MTRKLSTWGSAGRKRLLVWAVLTLGVLLVVTGCEGTSSGYVVNKVYREVGGHYLLEVQASDGTRPLVPVNKTVWDRCNPGNRYPDCGLPLKNPSKRKV